MYSPSLYLSFVSVILHIFTLPGKLLGSGNFGRVVKGTVTGLEGPESTTVAVKMCKSDLDVSQLNALTVELKIMIHMGKHLNIVNLIGANTVNINKGKVECKIIGRVKGVYWSGMCTFVMYQIP